MHAERFAAHLARYRGEHVWVRYTTPFGTENSRYVRLCGDAVDGYRARFVNDRGEKWYPEIADLLAIVPTGVPF